MRLLVKLSLLVGLGIPFVYLPNSLASEINMMNSTSFKVTIIQAGIEYEWEYYNPDEFEWEHGNTVEKDELAKQKVMEMFKTLEITNNSRVDELVSKLKNSGFEEMDHLDIRWINEDGKLYTWIWNKPSS